MLPTMVKMSISATSLKLDSREAAILAFLSAIAGSQATVFLTVHRLQKLAKTQLGRWIITRLIIINHATFVNQERKLHVIIEGLAESSPNTLRDVRQTSLIQTVGSCNGSLFFCAYKKITANSTTITCLCSLYNYLFGYVSRKRKTNVFLCLTPIGVNVV